MSIPRSKYDWPFHINNQKESGLTVKEYCKQQGFSINAFYINRQKLNRSALQEREAVSSTSTFVNLGVLKPNTDNNAVLTVVFPDGIRLEIRSQQSTEQLRNIISTLRDC